MHNFYPILNDKPFSIGDVALYGVPETEGMDTDALELHLQTSDGMYNYSLYIRLAFDQHIYIINMSWLILI